VKRSSSLVSAFAPASVSAFVSALVVTAACSANKPTSNEARAADPPAVAPATAAAALPPPDPREKLLCQAVLNLFEEQHLLRKHLDDEISRAAFDNYIERIDGGKMFLLREQRQALAKYADEIDDQLRFGSLVLAHEGARLFVSRVEVVDKIVTEVLAKPVDLTNDEWIELDPKKTEFAVTEDELKDRWRRRIELEVLERVAQMEAQLNPDVADGAKPGSKTRFKTTHKPVAAPPAPGKITPLNGRKLPPVGPESGDDKGPITPLGSPSDAPVDPIAKIPPTPEGREAKARVDLAKSYSGRFARLRTPGPLEAASDLINAVASTLDPHSDYLPPADKANFDIRMSGSLEGIGAVLRERDHYVEVVELVPGGASWRNGGLSAGDLILSVSNDGQEPIDVLDMHIDDVVKMIRGPKGTVVRLRIQKATGIQETLDITRDVVVIEEAYARGAELSRKGKPSIGYINLPSFYGGAGTKRTASADIRRLLGELRARKVRGIILDIRSNGGGLLGDAVKLTGEFIDHGPVVQVQDGGGRGEILDDDEAGVDFNGPVIVLVDRFSASASEILAGALQDYRRAIIVGTTTHGKGTVQTLADLDRMTGGQVELGVLKLTIQQFFRVSGSSTQREGVTPDIALPDPAGHFESGERTLDHAIAWSKVKPAPHDDWAGSWDLPSLVKNSAGRVAKHPILAKIAAASAVLKARASDTRVPLTRQAFDARRKEQRRALEAVSPDLKAEPPAFGVSVIADHAAPPPRPNGKPDDSITHWRENLSRDPWVDECLSILGDVIK
jgi:carboxyl-terminal processing protease